MVAYLFEYILGDKITTKKILKQRFVFGEVILYLFVTIMGFINLWCQARTKEHDACRETNTAYSMNRTRHSAARSKGAGLGVGASSHTSYSSVT